MAKFTVNGVDGLELSLSQLASIPPKTINDIVMAGANVVRDEQEEEIRRQGLMTTKKRLVNSIVVQSKVYTAAFVYPKGNHHKVAGGVLSTGKSTKFGKSASARKRSYTKIGESYVVTNAEVGFVLNYGAPQRNLSPRQWVTKANDKSQVNMLQAEQKVFDEYIDTLNL